MARRSDEAETPPVIATEERPTLEGPPTPEQSAPAPPSPPAASPPSSAVVPEMPPRAPVFVVSDGHTVTARRGAMHAGEVVSGRDFGGGLAELVGLLKTGAIVQKK